MKESREVKIEYATRKDLPTIMQIMHAALELTEDKSWYAVDGEEFVGKCIEGQGFTLAATIMLIFFVISLLIGTIGAPVTRGKSLEQITRERYGEDF